MNERTILDRLTEVFQDVFGDEDLTISEDLQVGTIDGWDSLRHVRLLSAIESEFDVAFCLEQIAEIKRVRDIVDLLDERV